MSYESEPHLEVATLEKLRALTEPEDEIDFLDDVIETYCADMPPLILDLAKDVAAKNSHGVEKTAHRIKGSSKEMGAARMFALCRDLEAAGNKGQTETFDSLLKEVQAEYNIVESELREKWIKGT